MTLFDQLGFRWDRDTMPRQVPRSSVERAIFRFHRMLPEYVWDAGALEGNPFTFPEVKTLVEGVTVGGRSLSDQEQILNLAASSRRLLQMLRQRRFALDRSTFCELQGLVARNEAHCGDFRGTKPDTPSTPGASELNRLFADGVRVLTEHVREPFERALAFFFFGALQQFFFDGNKPTSRFMMNGVLMSEGVDAISVPAARAQEFNSKMVDFYVTKDATEMMAFLVDCHPDAAELRKLTPS